VHVRRIVALVRRIVELMQPTDNLKLETLNLTRGFSRLMERSGINKKE
jgi:hypothetical protein